MSLSMCLHSSHTLQFFTMTTWNLEILACIEIEIFCSISHQIFIDNLKPGEILHHSLVIIKGHVTNIPSSSCPQNNQISVESECSLGFKVIRGRFKALVELKEGQNSIKIRYCCSAITITLDYGPNNTQYCVIPLYIICKGHDGNFQAPETENNDIDSACKRITLCSKLLQSVCAEKLLEKDFGRKTFSLGSNCQVFRTKLSHLEAMELSQEELWTRMAQEIINSDLGKDSRRKFLGFLSCTRYRGDKYDDSAATHEDFVKLVDAYVALGGGGLALFGTPCLFTWPEELRRVIDKFEDGTVIDKAKFMDDSCYRGTYGACFSTTLGSVLHELCHTFDLGHTETGIMGRGFDNIYKVFVPVDEDTRSHIYKKYQSQVVFKENLQGQADQRIVGNAKSGEKDDTFWTDSCLMLLAYHKWFNIWKPSSKAHNIVLKFDPTSKFVTSTAGLRVVEFRQETDGLVLKSWTFKGRILKYSFQIPAEYILTVASKQQTLMIAMDNAGNIVKGSLPP